MINEFERSTKNTRYLNTEMDQELKKIEEIEGKLNIELESA